MKALKLVLIVLFLSVSPVNAEDIKLEGISGDVALVNGEVLKVGDSVGEVRIIGIGGEKVTFQDNNGKVFTKGLKANFWDQAVGNIKSFFDKKKRGANKEAQQSSIEGKKSGFFADFMKKLQPEVRSTKNLSLSEKKAFAEADQKEFKEEAGALISKLEKNAPSSGGIRREMKKFDSLQRKTTKRLNDLKLPCPSTVDPSSSYVSWSKRFQERDRRVTDDFNRRLQKISMDAMK
jgi:hypothetical protein